MINGTNHIFIEREGMIYEWDRHFTDQQKLTDIVQQIAASSNRIVNQTSPIVFKTIERKDSLISSSLSFSFLFFSQYTFDKIA